MPPRDDRLLTVLQRMSPGTPLREGIDRIIKASKGAIIVLGASPEVEAIVSGGFRLDVKFTAQRLSEVAKMDGAIILNDELDHIVWANVHLVPDSSVATDETGTRHRSAQRTARQTGVPVVSVSESMRIVSLYLDSMKHTFEDVSSILFRANQALATLERYRNRLDEVSGSLSALEIEDVVTLRDVLSVLQRAGMVRRIADEIEAYVAELGSDGRLLELQLDELMSGVEHERTLVVRDYLPDRRKKLETTVRALDELPAEQLLVLRRIAEIMGYDPETTGGIDHPVAPRGYRMLSRVPRLPDSVVDKLVQRFGTLPKLMAASLEDLDDVEGVGATRARAIKDNLARLAESSVMDRYA